MCDYVREIIAGWDKVKNALSDEGFKIVSHRKKGSNTAAPENLFKVDKDAVKLDIRLSTVFHNLVAKTLFVTKRARSDTSTAIAFLTTHV